MVDLHRLVLRRRNQLRRQVIRWSLHDRCEPQQAIVLTGSPRSGTTWAGQLLAQLPNYATLFETVMPARVPASADANLGYRPYRRPGQPWPEASDFFQNAFRGRVLNDWTAQELTWRSALHGRALVLKEVRLNRLLPWLAEEFPENRFVLMLRHPLATIASQIRAGWFTDTGTTRDARLGGDFPALADLPDVNGSLVARLAATWALDTVVPLALLRPGQAFVLCYEQLMADPEGVTDRLFNFLGSKPKGDLRASLAQASRMTNGQISAAGQWREVLRRDDAQVALRIIREAGLTFYDENPMPNLAALTHPALPAHLRRFTGFAEEKHPLQRQAA